MVTATEILDERQYITPLRTARLWSWTPLLRQAAGDGLLEGEGTLGGKD